tara:strand:+ start:1369 stop:2310 length:942 start_codon:yes stop_codon:yes gene_type:complete
LLTRYERVTQKLGQRIRRRLFLVFLTFSIGAATTWFYRVDIFAFLLIPGGDVLSPFDGQPVYTRPTGMMSATIGLALKGGAVVALPVATVGALTLLRPFIGRYWLFLVIFTTSVLLCFLGGAAFGYYVLLPTAMRFLLHFGEGIAVPVIDISEYLALFMAIVFWMGVVFVLPPVMYLLTKLRLVEYRSLRNVRKFVPASAFVLSAILTPTFDVVNQTMMAVPMIALYEVGLFVSWAARPEEGNYLWLKTVAAALRRLRDALAWPYRRVRRVTEKQIVIVVTVLCVAVWVWLLVWLLWDDLLELRWEVTQWAYR